MIDKIKIGLVQNHVVIIIIIVTVLTIIAPQV